MFKIDNTDFQIDVRKSRFKLRLSKAGTATIDADIYGDKSRYETITEDDDSPWSWTLYPPHFYIHGFPARLARTAGKASATIKAADLDEHEAAIYLIEHNDIDDVTITVDATTFRARGTVFLSGRPHAFSIKFTKSR